MFHGRITFSRLHERYLRLFYGDRLSTFEKLLEQDKSVTKHTRNLQILATKMFKVYQNISPSIFREVLEIFHRSVFTNQFTFRNDKRKVYFPWK